MTGSRQSDALRLSDNMSERFTDELAVESPLSIDIKHKSAIIPMGITMRTPGEDKDLAIGFLYSEGVIDKFTDIESISQSEDRISIAIRDEVEFEIESHRRHTITSAACGVCGKDSLTNLHKIHSSHLNTSLRIHSSQLSANLVFFTRKQSLFETTGGTHAAVAFSEEGEIIATKEDVGRHNALDKLIGHILSTDGLNSEELILHVSGRSSFELVQKTIRAGFPILASVGAASTLAVDLARECNLTLVCFLKVDSMVIHSAPNRIIH